MLKTTITGGIYRMKICKHCGAELADYAAFCSSCGMSSEDEPAVVEENLDEIPAAEEDVEEAPLVSDGITDTVKAELAEDLVKRKKKKRRKTLITSLIVLAVATAAVCIIIFTSPEYKLKSAIDSTAGDLEAIYENCGNLMDVISTADSLATSGQYTTDVSLNAVFSAMYDDASIDELAEYYDFTDEELIALTVPTSVAFDCSVDYDLNSKILNGSCSADIADGFQSMKLDAEFSADETQTLIRIPDYFSETFSINNDTFGDDFADSPLYDYFYFYDITKSQIRETKIEPFKAENDDEVMQQCEAEFKAFLKTVEVEKSSAKIVDFSGDVYRIRFEGKDLKILIKNCLNIVNGDDYDSDIFYQISLKNMLKEIREADYKVYAGIENGKLAAVSVQVNKGDVISIVLNGDENVWSDFSVYQDKSEIAYGGMAATENGMELEAKSTQVNASAVITVDDKAGSISVMASIMRIKAELFRIDYSENAGAVSIKAAIPVASELIMGIGDFSVEVSLSPLKNTPEMLAGKTVELLKMSEDAIDEIMEVIANIPTPQFEYDESDFD